jgi:hypothetical protein
MKEERPKLEGRAMSRTPSVSLVGALATFCALAASRPASGQTYIIFMIDNVSTYGSAINAGGAVTGDAVGDFFTGYVRAADGTITTFAPTLTTISTAINRRGAVAGFYQDNNDNNDHGFMRTPRGNIITFDPAGSAGTNPTAMNAHGDIAGYYADASGHAHGLLRLADGTITSFDVKNAQFTQAFGMNRNDAIVGYFFNEYGERATGLCRSASMTAARSPALTASASRPCHTASSARRNPAS